MRYISQTHSKKEAELLLEQIKLAGHKGLIKYDESYLMYKIYQTNHLNPIVIRIKRNLDSAICTFNVSYRGKVIVSIKGYNYCQSKRNVKITNKMMDYPYIIATINGKNIEVIKSKEV